jgi:hypothetical protein
MEKFSGAVLSGKSSILNNKSDKQSIVGKDSWARSIQTSMTFNETSTLSSLNWIKAFRSQSRGQEVTIPTVNFWNEDVGDEDRVEVERPVTPKQPDQKPKEINQKVECLPCEDIPPLASGSSYHIPSEGEVLSAASVRLVQDYIDLSSAISTRTPSLTCTRRQVTTVTNSSELKRQATKGNNQTSPPLRSHYSGMDRDDCISLMAPPKYADPTSQPSAPSNAVAPGLSITSIQSPRTQRTRRAPYELPADHTQRGLISGGGSLLGVGGEVLERDSVYFSVPQEVPHHRHYTSTSTADEDFESTPHAMSVTGTAAFSPIKSALQRSLPLPSAGSPLPDLLPESREPEPQRLRTRSPSREIQLQLPIPSHSIEFTETPGQGFPSSPSTQQLPPESHLLLHHNSSMLTKFETENTQTILNQYLYPAGALKRRPITTQHATSQRFHCARAVTPSLQAPWHDELREQQKALRTVFHSHNRYKHSAFKPQRPPPSSKRDRSQRSNMVPSPSLAVAPPPRQVHHHHLPREGSRAVPLEGVLGRDELDCDSVSEIQSVLNQMSQSQVPCAAIQPLERYNDTGTGTFTTVTGTGIKKSGEHLDDILGRLQLPQSIEQPRESTRGSESGRQGMGEKDQNSTSQASPIPRLLLTSPRLATLAPAPTPLRPTPRISLPAVNAHAPPSAVSFDLASPLHSLSIATVPGEGEQEAKRRTMSRRIIHTHQRPLPQSAATGR